MRDYTKLYNARQARLRPHDPSRRDVGDENVRRILDCAVIPPLESVPGGIGTKQRSRLGKERVAFARLGVICGEQLVDLHHESRERMEPVEPRVGEDEAEQSAAAFDAALLTLVPDARVLEQRLVDAEQGTAHVLELLSDRSGERARSEQLWFGHGVVIDWVDAERAAE